MEGIGEYGWGDVRGYSQRCFSSFEDQKTHPVWACLGIEGIREVKRAWEPS